MENDIQSVADTMKDLWVIFLIIGSLIGTLVYSYVSDAKNKANGANAKKPVTKRG
jgi:hypothetical protein